MTISNFETKVAELLAAVKSVSAFGWPDRYLDLERTTRNLVNIIRDRSIEFVAGRPMTDDQDGVILVFTRDALIRAKLTVGADNLPGTRIEVTSRKRLVSIYTEDDGRPEHLPHECKWTCGQTLILTYDGIGDGYGLGDVVVLPLSKPTAKHRADLFEFQESLFEDLNSTI